MTANPISTGLQILCLVTTQGLKRIGAHSVVLSDSGLSFGLPHNRHLAQQLQISREGCLYRVEAHKLTWRHETALEALVVYEDQIPTAIEQLTDLRVA
jgi:hypothetical protein